MRSNITGETKLYGLIGDPVEHTLSPFIMNRAFAAGGHDGVYVAFRVGRGDGRAAAAALWSLGVAGVNVTYPLKEEVLRSVDRTTPPVDAIGAANTLIRLGDGTEAHNTDAVGTARALSELAGVEPAGKRVFVFGAGGAARAAAYGLLDAGAAETTFAVRDLARSVPRLAGLRRRFTDRRIVCVPMREASAGAASQGPSGTAPQVRGARAGAASRRAGRTADSRHEPEPARAGIPPRGAASAEAEERMAAADIVIQATPVGMGGGEPLPVPRSAVHENQCFFDFVYDPRRTLFLETARLSGASTLDGLALLTAQAQATFELWTGRTFDLGDMYRAVTEHVSRKQGSPESEDGKRAT